jgi:hypothetical protein
MRQGNPVQEASGSTEPAAVLQFFGSSVLVLWLSIKELGILEPTNRRTEEPKNAFSSTVRAIDVLLRAVG